MYVGARINMATKLRRSRNGIGNLIGNLMNSSFELGDKIVVLKEYLGYKKGSIGRVCVLETSLSHNIGICWGTQDWDGYNWEAHNCFNMPKACPPIKNNQACCGYTADKSLFGKTLKKLENHTKKDLTGGKNNSWDCAKKLIK